MLLMLQKIVNKAPQISKISNFLWFDIFLTYEHLETSWRSLKYRPKTWHRNQYPKNFLSSFLYETKKKTSRSSDFKKLLQQLFKANEILGQNIRRCAKFLLKAVASSALD